ncbi:MAG TPA: hypothetical protein VIL10_05435 [Marmoricola sp.]|jgi:hypothetical protein
MGAAAVEMFPGHGWNWLPSHRADPRAYALYRRHYSAVKNARGRARTDNFMGPGETMVLLTAGCDAVFAWQCNVGAPRLDGQEGVCCTIFRNEGPLLSSGLIGEACELAWGRWPGSRLFTYVDTAAVKSANPGYCFLVAGFRRAGRSKVRKLLLLERLP